MKFTVIVSLVFIALVGAALYLYWSDMIEFAIGVAVITLVGLGALFSQSSPLAHHREADAQRRNKEDLPLFYKDKDGPR